MPAFVRYDLQNRVNLARFSCFFNKYLKKSSKNLEGVRKVSIFAPAKRNERV